MKHGDPFIPYSIFGAEYIDVVSTMDCLTRSEKRFLIILNGYAFKDGKCYPSQATIGRMMGSKKYGGPGRDMSTRQVRNVQASLQAKGFISVDRPSLIDRHLLGKTNRYKFLWCTEYEAASGKFSPEISGQPSPDAPIYQNPQPISIQSAAVAEPFEEIDKKTKDKIKSSADTVSDLLPKNHAFDPHLFARWAENRFPMYPAEVSAVALDAIGKRVVCAGSGGDLWAYGVSVIKDQGPKLHASSEVSRASAIRAAFDALDSRGGPGMALGAALDRVGVGSRGSSL